MAELDAEMGRIEAQFLGLEASLSGLESVSGAFRRSLDGVGGSFREAGRDASGMSRSVSTSVRRAFDGLVLDGKRLSDVLQGIGQSISGAVLNQALAPVQGAIGNAIGGGIQAALAGVMPFASGGVLGGGRARAFASGAIIDAGRVRAFASGGIVRGPVRFPMRDETGLMGEAGPEAIMPLSRGPDGRLGVRAGGGGSNVRVTINVTTPDVEGFRRSQSQIAAELSRALQRGGRNL